MYGSVNIRGVTYPEIQNEFGGWLTGGVPYGREIQESWAELQARTQTGNFSDLRIGDYKTITLTTGEVVVMEVAGIDTYYKCGDVKIGHHIDFISRDCLAGGKQFNATNTNNGTASEPNPWRASELFKAMNNESTGVFSTLPADLRPYIIEKRSLLETRYSASGALTNSGGRAWANAGKLWLPVEFEVYGVCVLSDYRSIGYVRSYPIFMGACTHRIKGDGNSGAPINWWFAVAVIDNDAHFCCHTWNGSIISYSANTTDVRVPLCFRIG